MRFEQENESVNLLNKQCIFTVNYTLSALANVMKLQPSQNSELRTVTDNQDLHHEIKIHPVQFHSSKLST